ncbi:GpE family phage tail protein [Desulfonatronovibrio hydrogenovorans]|nr:GpE family phage tail protein [Desulfonatronovibrio hydrogenovorans]
MFSFSPADLMEMDVDDIMWWRNQAHELAQEMKR